MLRTYVGTSDKIKSRIERNVIPDPNDVIILFLLPGPSLSAIFYIYTKFNDIIFIVKIRNFAYMTSYFSNENNIFIFHI